MPSVKISPLFNDAQLDNNGLPLAGGLVNWYLAGTTTPVIVYSESSGSIANTNPVVLNTRGEPSNPIWLQAGSVYKAVLNDSLGNLIRTVDNISGVNDTSVPIISEWVLYSGAATYISGSSFSVAGDTTATFDTNRRVKATVSGTDRYGTISGSVFSLGVTTVTLVLDSGVLDASLATVYYGFLDPAHPSFDSTGVNTNTQAGVQKQSWTAFTTGGASGVYTLTPSPVITVYVAGERFNVTFNAASAATNTINVNGLGDKSIKQYDYSGTKIASSFALNQVSDIVYDGTDFVLLNELPVSFVSPVFTGVPTAPTATSGTNTTQIATTANVYGSSLGWGQTWQNVKSSRVSGTSYTNSTGKPIMVAVAFPDTGGTASVTVVVGGVTLINLNYDIGSGSAIAFPVFIVPNGTVYTVTAGGATISFWSELR